MSYKLFQSKKWIFWDNPAQNDYPDFITNDSYFDWVEVPTNNINFETYKSGKITVKDKDITYFKLQKDNEQPTFWFVKNIDKILSNGYVYNVELDYYMSYTRHLLNDLTKNIHENTLLNANRVSLATGMLEDDDLRHILISSTTLTDPLIENIQKTYKDMEVKTQKHTGRISVLLPDKQITKLDLRYGSNVVKREFLGSANMCAVFVNKDNNVYDCFPIVDSYKSTKNDNEFSQLYSNWITGSIDSRNVNQYHNSIQNLIELLPRTSTYGTKGFVGVFQYPYRFGSFSAQLVTDGTNNDTKWYFLRFTLNPTLPDIKYYPLNIQININDSLIALFSELHDDIQFSKVRNKRLHYFKHIKKQGNNWIIRPMFYVSFSNEFLLIPALNAYCDARDIEGFGGQLPSPDDEYVARIFQARQNFDMGLTSLAGSATNAITGTILGGAVGGFAGAGASLVGSAISTGLQYYQLEKAYKQQIAGASQSWVTSNSTDIFFNLQFLAGIKTDTSIWQPTSVNDGMREMWFEYPLTDNTKQMIKQTYHLFGFAVNAFINFRKMLDRSYFQKRFYIQLDEQWTLGSIRRLCKQTPILANESSEILQAIAQQFINGMRIWLNNEPNYDDIGD